MDARERDFAERLKRGPVLLDGALGSLFMARGLRAGEPPETWNAERAAVVQGVHRAYFEAGADVVSTNTFGGTRMKLQSRGLGDRCEELNRAAVEIALSVRPEGGFIAGDIGPTGRVTGFPEAVPHDAIRESFREQVGVLAGAGVDLFVIETMYDLAEARLALAAARATGLPVIASMTFQEKPRGFFTLMGDGVADCLRSLGEEGALAVGANCTLDAAGMLGLMRLMRPATSLPLLVQPNAGQPVLRGGEAVYSATPETFAREMKTLLEEGAQLVGGCCGTTPAFIHALSSKIEEYLAHRNPD